MTLSHEFVGWIIVGQSLLPVIVGRDFRGTKAGHFIIKKVKPTERLYFLLLYIIQNQLNFLG